MIPKPLSSPAPSTTPMTARETQEQSPTSRPAGPLAVQRAALSPANQPNYDAQSAELQPGGPSIQQQKAGPDGCIETPGPAGGAVENLADGRIELQRGTHEWNLRLWGFDSNQGELRPAHTVALATLKREADEHVAADCEVQGWYVVAAVGHSSPEGAEKLNSTLAKQRAGSVLAHLPGTIAPTSSGEACAADAARDAFPYHRAVELTINFHGASRPADDVDAISKLEQDKARLESKMKAHNEHFVRYAVEATAYGSHEFSDHKVTTGSDTFVKIMGDLETVLKGKSATDSKVELRTQHTLRHEFETRAAEQRDHIKSICAEVQALETQIAEEKARSCK